MNNAPYKTLFINPHARFDVAHKAIIIVLAALLSFAAKADNTVTVLTDSWEPYITPPEQPLGTAAKLLAMLLDDQGLESRWQHLPYELSFHQVENNKRLLSFPYFKTTQRQNAVIYSDPIFSVTSKVYYNRAFMSLESAKAAYISKQRVGKVAGYSYGQSIDKEVEKASVYASEKQALTALFNHDIDVLPMTEGVMNHQLSHHFQERKQLILAIDNIADTSSLHAVAAKNAEGKAIIDKINHGFNSLNDAGISSIQTTTTAMPEPVDIARLITSEGYPLIIGQTAAGGDNIDYYSLPQGTKALIIEWSQKIRQPSKTDRIYKNMMDLSKVVLLNGPHVGKELFVRNMHIELL